VQHYAKANGIQFVSLNSKASFAELVKQQNQFPSVQFQWCAGFLKGLVINEFLDQIDMSCEAIILLAKRRCDSRANLILPRRVDSSEHYNDRAVWYPLLDCNDEKFSLLLEQTQLPRISTRSLECAPCIHSNYADFTHLDEMTIARLEQLEQQQNQTMFSHPIRVMCQQAKGKGNESSSIETMDMGCGSVWGCGE